MLLVNVRPLAIEKLERTILELLLCPSIKNAFSDLPPVTPSL
jgi:hypothetical protein